MIRDAKQSNDPVSSEPPPHAWRLQFGLLGGGVAWLLHLLLAYLVSEFGCLLNLGTVMAGPISMVAWGLLVVSLLTLAMAAAAAVVSLQLRRMRRPMETDEADLWESVAFTGRSGLFMNVLFVFIILVQSIPIFYFLTDC